jgi:drug/metabolite transporter (DMT)-like permease
MEMMAGGLLLVIWGLLHGELTRIHPELFSFKSIVAFVYLIFFGSLVGFTAYIWLLKNVGVTKASTYAFVNPVIAVILGCLLNNEQLNTHILLAGAFIIISVIVITMNHREEKVETIV